MKKALFSFMAVLAVIGLVFAGCGGGGGTTGTGGEGGEDGDDAFTITFSDGITGIDITDIDNGSLVDGVLEGSFQTVGTDNGWVIAFDLPNALNLSGYDGIRYTWGISALDDGAEIVSTKGMFVVRISHETGMGIFGKDWYQPMNLKLGEDPTQFSFDGDFINWADSTSDAALAGATKLWFELIYGGGFVVEGEGNPAYDAEDDDWDAWDNDVPIPNTSTWYIYSIEFFKD